MSYDEQNVFSFHLNESLWFQRGQEVDEFMGISLEPDISIQEFDDTVSIRGVIELTGEYYQTKEQVDEEPQVLSLRDHAAKRLIEEVETHEDGVSECYHRFPVEISIPKSRIENLHDVTVSIDSFDYELPERGQLKLNATVAIHGVNHEEISYVQEEQRNDFQDQEEFEGVHYDELESRFSFDVKYEEDEDQEEPVVADSVDHQTLEQDDDSSLTEDEGGRWKYKQVQSFSEFFGNEAEAPPSEEDVEETEEHEYSMDYEDSYEDDREEEEEHYPQDARYLTSMFQREEEPYAKMRMCIVQESDTLGSIAQKYKVPPTHLSRINDLGDEDVSAGQILYIPSK
ncbi:stage VI sporulation protein D [Pontibacillus yanchengensis]|uniref:Stage VI sporulation protein D n=1 Tax=Pontibacillus yanchengensis TaxID=462910 RepID=A0ACC7VD30_9BACI|nr:stage VI sporulation protein D [Pontibacillus yanchengensis]MYL53338.1 stage VI sporulation protein D [Pontibacillus yanchengensis]